VERFTLTECVSPLRRCYVVISLLAPIALAACSDSGTRAPVDDQAMEAQSPVVAQDPASQSQSPATQSPPAQTPVSSEQDFVPPSDTGVFPPQVSDVGDNLATYQQDGYASVDVIRVDLRIEAGAGPCTPGDYSGCTLNDVLSDVNSDDDFKPRVNVHFRADDYPEDGSISNAELFQRGGSTRSADQKSFRIKLDMKNKLAFDLMAEIPHLPSSRTQFVNLWIDSGQGPVDQGLYTHVENPGSNYLEKHGFDRDDRLYKTEFFNFSLSDLRNVRVDASGEPIDEDQFERSLEIEAGDDHRPLVQMLTDLHDPTRSFESVLDQYFNRNNVLTWMAVNFLLHQTDAVTHNFIMLNPQGSEKFYFLPWDYDGGFSLELEPPAASLLNVDLQKRLFYGYARGHTSEFHRRYYALPGIHQEMIEAVASLRMNYITDSNVNERATRYESVVRPFATRAGSQWLFEWSPAIEVTGNDVSYDLQISSTVQFAPNDIVYSATDVASSGVLAHRVDAALLLPQDHFVRIIARASNDPMRFWQVAENQVIQDGIVWFGMRVVGHCSTFRGKRSQGPVIERRNIPSREIPTPYVISFTE